MSKKLFMRCACVAGGPRAALFELLNLYWFKAVFDVFLDESEPENAAKIYFWGGVSPLATHAQRINGILGIFSTYIPSIYFNRKTAILWLVQRFL